MCRGKDEMPVQTRSDQRALPQDNNSIPRFLAMGWRDRAKKPLGAAADIFRHILSLRPDHTEAWKRKL
jgi:hypothetical protein